MQGDPIAALDEAVKQFESDRRRSLEAVARAADAVEAARRSRSGSAAKALSEAAGELKAAVDRLSRVQFHGSYKGTNASFLPAQDRRLLAAIAVGASAVLAGWVFLIATLAAARLETGQTLALGGLWILVAVVAGFLIVSVALAYGFRSVAVELRSVEGELAQMERSDEIRARKRLERQLAQATKDAERAHKRATEAIADADALRAAARAAEVAAPQE